MLVGDYFPELKDEDCEMWVFRTKNHTYLWWRYTIPWRRSGFRTVRLLQCNVLSPSCFQHHSDLEWKEAAHASTHQGNSWGVAGRFNIILILKFWHVVLTENEVVGPKDLSKWSGSDGIHRTGFQIDKNCSWYIFSTWKICRVDNNKLSVMVARSYFQIEDNARNATRTREMKCFKGQQAIPVASL